MKLYEKYLAEQMDDPKTYNEAKKFLAMSEKMEKDARKIYKELERKDWFRKTYLDVEVNKLVNTASLLS